MKNVLTIFKKEFTRVIKDKRLVLSVILFPGLMIFLIYSLMGNAITNIDEGEKLHVPRIEVVNMFDEFNELITESEIDLKINHISPIDITDEKLLLIENKELDLIIHFDEDFSEKVTNKENPQYQIYYNPTEANSQNAYYAIMNLITMYENKKITEIFGEITIITHQEPVEIFDKIKAQGKFFAMMLPFLLITFLFGGAMSIGPESISGEKERGTIATLLITPIKRSELAFGKILSLSVIAIMSATSSFIGIMLSLPKMLGSEVETSNIYSVTDYLMIFLVLLSTIVLIVGAISIISAFAKSVKEASLYILPLYLVSMVVGLLTMFSESATPKTYAYFIPIFNSVQSLTAILSFDVSITNVVINVGANIIFAIGFSLILAKMFTSERIMFAK